MTREEVEAICDALWDKRKASHRSLWKDWKFIVGLPSSILAMGALWVFLGFPTPATSEDIKRLDRNGAETAVQAYQNAVTNLLANTPPKDAPIAQQKAWQQQFDQYNKALDRAIDRKIELSR
jgi:hypothetical protein